MINIRQNISWFLLQSHSFPVVVFMFLDHLCVHHTTSKEGLLPSKALAQLWMQIIS